MSAQVAAARVAKAELLNQSGIVHPALGQILNAFRIAVQFHLIKSGGVRKELSRGRQFLLQVGHALAKGEMLGELNEANQDASESVITSFSLAGFEVAFAFPLVKRFSGLGLGASGITGMAGFAVPKSVITSLAGFGACRPQLLGGRQSKKPTLPVRIQHRTCPLCASRHTRTFFRSAA